jgi:outer membrane lipoprotein carrier protein
MLKKSLTAFFLALLVALPAAGAEDAPVRKLRAFLAKAATLKADFSQVLINENGKTGQKSSGLFYLQRPGKFRWDYTQPYQQEIVSNGGKVWFYDVDLEQVTAKKLDQAIGSTPALLLSGETALETNFKIEEQSVEEGLYWLKLLPKSEDSSFKYVLIGLDGDMLAGMELSDHFGQLTRIYFSNVKTGVKLESGLFEFKPPAGVDVFEEK